jgi:hypothetical protein
MGQEEGVRGYLDTILGLLAQTDLSKATGQLSLILSSVLTGSGTCPQVTVTPPLEDLESLPQNINIFVNYGTGCWSEAAQATMSGSATLDVTDLVLGETVVTADYTLAFNTLAQDGVVFANGSVNGSLDIKAADSVLTQASATMNFVDLTVQQYHISGQINLVASGVDLNGGSLGQVTATFKVLALGGFKIVDGTLIIASLSDNQTQIDANMTTSEGPVDITALVAVSGASDEIVTVNTASPGIIGDYTVELGNIVMNSDVCPSYPIAGTITLQKGEVITRITFTDVCDGTYEYVETR